VPMNFIAVRLSTAYLHPRVLGSTSNLPGPMALTFLVSLLAMALLFATMCQYELAAKHTRARLRALRRRLAALDGEAGGEALRVRSAAPALQHVAAPAPAAGRTAL
jgi:hypothetical protein